MSGTGGSDRDPNFRQYIASGLKHARLRRQFSQSMVARLAGIDQAQVSQFENKRVLPKMDTFFKLIGALDIGPGEFFSEFDRQWYENAEPLDASIDIVARRLSQEIHKTTRTDIRAWTILQDYEKGEGQEMTLLADLLVRTFFVPRFTVAAGKAKELGDYQKFVIGELIGLMLGGGNEPSGQPGDRLFDDA